MSEFAHRRQWGPKPRYEMVNAYVPPSTGFVKICGPCSVESKEQIEKVAEVVKNAGATHLRGGVFRAGTYPGATFGLQLHLLPIYKTAAKLYDLKNIVEVIDYRTMDLIDPHADCYQVGCRQMQTYPLLREVGRSGKPVFLKRHPGATIDEFLGAAEHVLQAGCKDLHLIERGSSTQATHVRWDLSISMVPAIREITRLPVIVDASHGTGRRDLVWPMTLAGVAAGANGILLETHPDPDKSISDSDQALSFSAFELLMEQIDKVRGVL